MFAEEDGCVMFAEERDCAIFAEEDDCVAEDFGPLHCVGG